MMQVLRDILGLGTIAQWVFRFLDSDAPGFFLRRRRKSAGPGSEDLNLVTDALRGRAEAMDALIRRMKPEILKVARLVALNQHDVEVLAGRIFLRVFRSLKRYRTDTQLDTWVTQTAVAVGLHEARPRSCRVTSWTWDERDLVLLQDLGEQPDGVSPAQASALLERLLSCLPPAERLVKRLHDLEGESIDTICQRTGWTEKRVRRLFESGSRRVDDMIERMTASISADHGELRH